MFFLGKEIDLDRSQPSLAHIFAVRGMLGKQMQSFAPDASEYLQPYLNALDLNKPCAGITSRAITTYEEVIERRGAELILRIASNIQYMKNVLDIIHEINNVDFHNCDQNFMDQVEAVIQLQYESRRNTSTECTTSSASTQAKMVITRETCEEAVSIFLTVLMPQHFTLMNSRINNDLKETHTQLILQTKILKLKYRIFYKSMLYGNDGILKNIDKDAINYLLDRLIRRGILKKGKFLKSANSPDYESYLKYLPLNELEQQDLEFELNKHHMSLEEYQEIYHNSDVSPSNTFVTGEGHKELQNQNSYVAIPKDGQDHPLPSTANTSIHSEEPTTGKQINHSTTLREQF